MSGVVVVGGGVGGLAAAIRLRAAGHDVELHERNDWLGGKLTVREREGFTFDVGPSLVTLPHVLDELFRAAGTSLLAEVPMVRLDPQFRYVWPDGREVVVRDDGCDVVGHREFVEHGREIWEVSERTFFAGAMAGPLSLARRMRSPRDLLAIDPLRSLDRAARQAFPHDPQMVQWAGRYATYSGSSPRRAPATLACIAFVESEYGCWYPLGGLGSLRDALVRTAERSGVRLHCGSDVVAISRSGNRADGVVLAGGRTVGADVVVADVDARHLYADLLHDRRAVRRLERAERSTSGFVVLAGVRGRTDGVAHHNVWFSSDARREFASLDAGRLADEPTIYACVSSVTDPSQAPADAENWFVLVNVPAGAEIDAEAYEQLVLDELARRGTDIRARTLFTETMTPLDFERRDRSAGGAIYGTSSNGWRAAFVRPRNRTPLLGLYLVGGSSHPGGGLPLVAMSGRIVAELVAADATSTRR
jgi:phytoene desaturase